MGYVMTVLVGWMQPEGRQTDSLAPCSIGRLVSCGFVSSRVGSSRAESSGVSSSAPACVWWLSGQGSRDGLALSVAGDRGSVVRCLGGGCILNWSQSRLNGPSFAAPIQGPFRLVQAPRC